MSKLGQRVRELRLQRGWSQRKLAEAVGVTHGFIGQLESGTGKAPSEKLVAVFATELKCDFGELMALSGRLTKAAKRELETNPDQVRKVEGFLRPEVEEAFRAHQKKYPKKWERHIADIKRASDFCKRLSESSRESKDQMLRSGEVTSALEVFQKFVEECAGIHPPGKERNALEKANGALRAVSKAMLAHLKKGAG